MFLEKNVKKKKKGDCDFKALSVSISFSEFDCIFLYFSILIWWLLLEGRDRVIFCFFLPCLYTCFVVYVIAVGYVGWMGKRSYLCWVSWFNYKNEEALYAFGNDFFGFFERLVWLLWRVVGGLSPFRSVGNEGTFVFLG